VTSVSVTVMADLHVNEELCWHQSWAHLCTSYSGP
jgi:hypothetical protein